MKLVLLGTPSPACRSLDQAPMVCIASALQHLCCAVQAVMGMSVLTAQKHASLEYCTDAHRNM